LSSLFAKEGRISSRAAAPPRRFPDSVNYSPLHARRYVHARLKTASCYCCAAFSNGLNSSLSRTNLPFANDLDRVGRSFFVQTYKASGKTCLLTGGRFRASLQVLPA
jgi:hypothetical protein